MRKLFIILCIFLSGCGTASNNGNNKVISATFDILSAEGRADALNKEEATVQVITLDGPVTVFDESYRDKEVYQVTFKTDDGDIVYFVSMDTLKIVAVPGVM